MELKNISVGDFLLARPIRVAGERTVISAISVSSIQPGGIMSNGKYYSAKKYTFEYMKTTGRKSNV